MSSAVLAHVASSTAAYRDPVLSFVTEKGNGKGFLKIFMPRRKFKFFLKWNEMYYVGGKNDKPAFVFYNSIFICLQVHCYHTFNFFLNYSIKYKKGLGIFLFLHTLFSFLKKFVSYELYIFCHEESYHGLDFYVFIYDSTWKDALSFLPFFLLALGIKKCISSSYSYKSFERAIYLFLGALENIYLLVIHQPCIAKIHHFSAGTMCSRWRVRSKCDVKTLF